MTPAPIIIRLASGAYNAETQDSHPVITVELAENMKATMDTYPAAFSEINDPFEVNDVVAFWEQYAARNGYRFEYDKDLYKKAEDGRWKIVE